MKKNLLTGIYAITPDNLKKEELYKKVHKLLKNGVRICLLYTSPSPRDGLLSRMPSSA